MTRADIVAAARGWIGTPYHHQASLKGIGCDCLGLLRGVWREVVGAEPASPPPYTRDWAEAGGRERLIEAALTYLQPIGADAFGAGDVLVFRWRPRVLAKHCGIATSPAAMVHAHEGAAVAEVALSPWWSRHLAAAFRFPGIAP